MARLKDKYQQEVVPKLMEQFGYTNRMAAPRLVKICLNMGVGKARDDAKVLDQAAAELVQITGQKCVVTKAKKSVSNFRLRRGYGVGCRVTLRGARMFEFLDRLVTLTIPRIRDFRGVSPKGFDGQGNFNMGLSEQTVFPEIDPDKVTNVQGMHINIVTTAQTPEEGLALLSMLGVPFSKQPQQA